MTNKPTKMPKPAASQSKPSPQNILDQLEMWGQKLGLERIQTTLTALGRPDTAFPVVLVAGTNGKGSTAAFLASILNSAGYRCGLFTSPHLQSVRERVRVAGRAIDSLTLHKALGAVVAASTGNDQPLPSYFEAITAAALLHFEHSEVDIAVLEVGLGGRLDATNATEPMLSVITSIAHDHQEHLGHRLDQIAREKAGIARVGKPLLAWAPRQAGVQRELREQSGRGVDVEEVWRGLAITSDSEGTSKPEGTPLPAGASPSEGKDGPAEPSKTLAHFEVQSTLRGVHSFTVCCSATPPQAPRTYQLTSQLLGEHQQINAAIALRAAERLTLMGFPRINSAAITAGIACCRWPGRLEVVDLQVAAEQDRPTNVGEPTATSKRTYTRRILLDGAHNLAGARALAVHLARNPSRKYNLVFASLRGKKAAAALQVLASWVDRIWITSPTSHRALPADALLQKLERSAPQTAQRCQAIAPFEHTLETAWQASPSDLIICGSLYAVGEARTWLHLRFGQPQPAAEINLFSPD